VERGQCGLDGGRSRFGGVAKGGECGFYFVCSIQPAPGQAKCNAGTAQQGASAKSPMDTLGSREDRG